MSSSRAIYMLPALVLSVLAIVLAIIGLSREPAAPPPTIAPQFVVDPGTQQHAEAPDRYRYWALAQPASVGELLTEDHLMIVTAPRRIPGALPVDEHDVVGRSLRRNVRSGEVLGTHHLEATGALAHALQPGFRAMAIAVDEVSGVGGLLEPGDMVDVLANFRDAADQREPSAMILMRNVELVAVGGLMQGAEVDSANRDRRGRGSTVVLAVPEASVPRLALASANGSLRLTAVSARDISELEENGDTDARLERVAVEPGEGLVRYRELFPAPPRAPARPRGPQVEIIEGSETRSVNVSR